VTELILTLKHNFTTFSTPYTTKTATYLYRYVPFNVVPSTQVTPKHNSRQVSQFSKKCINLC